MAAQSTVAMIPARVGSTRLKLKNLALINGEPMIGHVIRAAKEAACFDRVVVNSDGAVFGEIAARYGVEFYQRRPDLGGSSIKSDDVVRDFIGAHPAEIVAWVNTTSPLQPSSEIRAVMSRFQSRQVDSVFTVRHERVHCVYQDRPINFSTGGKFAQTQDLEPVGRFVYSMMAWRTAPFLESMERFGHAFFTGNVAYHPVSGLSAIIIKTEEDLRLADFVARSLAAGQDPLKYDPLAESISGKIAEA